MKKQSSSLIKIYRIKLTKSIFIYMTAFTYIDYFFKYPDIIFVCFWFRW